MRIVALHGIDDLAGDMRTIATQAPRKLSGAVRDGIRAGSRLARENAERTARSHGKHYPKSITAEMTGLLVGEYGPDSSMPQGGMSFEFGSRNQPPHLDLAKSADILGPAFADAIGDEVEGWFW